jgi:hypothetical protein
MLRRTFHDNLPDSRHNAILQNNLEQTIRFFVSHYVVPGLRMNDDKAMQRIKDAFKSDVVEPYSVTSYSLGARYVKQLVNSYDNYNSATLSTDLKDKEILNSLNEKYTDQFWNLIKSFNNMQRTENRQGYQIVAGEKERLAGEFASTICWTSFNQGIKNKGIENKEKVATLGEGQGQIAGIIREIKSKDLKSKRKQVILTRRLDDKDREKLSAQRQKNKKAIPETLPISLPKLERFLKTREELRSDIVFVLITQRDERVCEECRDLELEFWHSEDDDIPDVPVHNNCRCRLALAENEFEQ